MDSLSTGRVARTPFADAGTSEQNGYLSQPVPISAGRGHTFVRVMR